MVAGPKISSPKTRANKKRQFQLSPLQKQLVVGFVLISALVLFFTIVWYVSRISSLQIASVEVVGGFTIDHEAVKKVVESELSDTYFKLVPKRFIFMYPEEAIITTLKTFPRMKEIVLVRSGTTLLVTFVEYEPYALWCKDESDETCLFIDNVGYAFSEAPQLTGNAFIRFMKDEDDPQLAQAVFPSDFLRDARIFSEDLERELSLFVTHVHAKGTYDIDFTLAGGGLIKVSQTKPLADSFSNLKTILSSEDFKHLEPGNFQYIDLRFGDKVFVNEDMGLGSDTSSSTPDELDINITVQQGASTVE